MAEVDALLEKSILAQRAKKQKEADSRPKPEDLRGASAYQVWLSQGNTGTPTDFFRSLKGEKGDKGDDGQSIKGDKGDKGDDGRDGVSVVSISEKFTSDNSLILYFHFSDGSTDMVTTGSLKGEKGDDGKDGVGIKTIKSKFNADDSLTIVVVLDDGRSYKISTDSLRGAQGLNSVSTATSGGSSSSPTYGLNDKDLGETDASYFYYGYESSAGDWYVKRFERSTKEPLYFAGVAPYSDGWSGRAGYTYVPYGEAF